MKTRAGLYKFIGLIIPACFLIAGLNFNRLSFVNDPDYIYLMNALCICDGEPVGHIDNPGTTVMQIGAASMVIQHLKSNPDNRKIVNHVIAEPEKFVEGICKTIVLLNALVLALLAWVALKTTQSVWVALLFQLSTLLSTNTLDHILSKLSPEPVLFFITGIYVVTILFYYVEENKNRWKYVILFALISGFGLGTKATFLPLTILPFIVLPTSKKKFAYLFGIIPSFVLFTIPAIPQYKSMYHWFKNMILHSGIYGHGGNGIIDTKTYLPNVVSILKHNPPLLIVISTALVVLGISYFYNRNNKPNWNIRILSGLLATLVFGILLVAKHYKADHYLIPEILLVGITSFFILETIRQFLPPILVQKYLLPAFALLLILYVGWKQPKQLKIIHQSHKNANQEIDSINSLIATKYSNYTRVNYYIYSLNKYTALKFGDDYARGTIRPYLKKMYPDTYFYEFSSDRYLNWAKKTNLNQIIQLHGNKILLVNGPNDEVTLSEMSKRNFPLKKVFEVKSCNLHILDTLKYIPPKKERATKIESVVTCNMDTFSSNNKFLVGSNNELFGSSYAKSNDTAHSGNYSLKLNKKHAFAIDYKIKNVQTDEMYEIDVWRKSVKENGYLVVSTYKSKKYYQAQFESVETDENGWELLRIKIKVTSDLSGEDLIINLWNERRRPVYFDDLSVKKLVYRSPE